MLVLAVASTPKLLSSSLLQQELRSSSLLRSRVWSSPLQSILAALLIELRTEILHGSLDSRMAHWGSEVDERH